MKWKGLKKNRFVKIICWTTKVFKLAQCGKFFRLKAKCHRDLSKLSTIQVSTTPCRGFSTYYKIQRLKSGTVIQWWLDLLDSKYETRGVINFRQTPQFPWLGAQGKFKENQVTWDWAWRQKICWSQLVPKKLQNILAVHISCFCDAILTWVYLIPWTELTSK